jgi:GT2 family glycosyltransferase
MVGNISPEYRHTNGDLDYGYRAREVGFQNWVAPGFAGSCRRNPPGLWADPTVPLRLRWSSVNSLKGVPLRQRYLFCRRHHGLGWPVDVLKLLLAVLFPGPWHWLKRVSGRT